MSAAKQHHVKVELRVGDIILRVRTAGRSYYDRDRIFVHATRTCTGCEHVESKYLELRNKTWTLKTWPPSWGAKVKKTIIAKLRAGIEEREKEQAAKRKARRRK